MRISDWSSDVCSSDLISTQHFSTPLALAWLVSHLAAIGDDDIVLEPSAGVGMLATWADRAKAVCINEIDPVRAGLLRHLFPGISVTSFNAAQINQHVSVAPTVVIMNPPFARNAARSEEHTSELQSLMRISYAVFCLKK